MQGYETEDTICALSTASGVGAIAVIRLSGEDSIPIVDKLFAGKNLLAQEANTLHFGKIKDGEVELDEVVVGLFKAPNSYTGEDIVEISCHGSPFIQSEILKLLVKNGARAAKEGEFTLRAFMNRKLDLSQAEAVADLISSDSKASRDLAMSQLRGGYSKKLSELRDELINFASMLELELDFAEEDVDFANRDDLKELINRIRETLDKLTRSFEQGNVLKNGVPVAIIGKPNVGKSTLLNAILQEDRAIVSDIPGTTRDVIEDEVSIGGVMFRFIDTAGLRETDDKVESIGIERARKMAVQARIIIHLTDATDMELNSEFGVRNSEFGNGFHLNVVNKIDKVPEDKLTDLGKKLNKENSCFISAKEGSGIEELLDKLLEFVNSGQSEEGGVVISNIRHLEALQKSDEALERAFNGLENNISSELVAMDVRQSLHYLGEITGEVTTDDLLGNIFSKFCIGK